MNDSIQLDVALTYQDLLRVYGALAINTDTLARAGEMLRRAEAANQQGLSRSKADGSILAVVDFEVRTSRPQGQVDGVEPIVPVRELPGIPCGATLLEVVVHGIDITLDPHDGNVDALSRAVVGDPPQPRWVGHLLEERRSQHRRDAVIEIVEGGAQEAAVLERSDALFVDIRLAVVGIGPDGLQQVLRKWSGQCVLVEQGPARDCGEELAELGLAGAGESPDQHERRIGGRTETAGCRGIEYP